MVWLGGIGDVSRWLKLDCEARLPSQIASNNLTTHILLYLLLFCIFCVSGCWLSHLIHAPQESSHKSQAANVSILLFVWTSSLHSFCEWVGKRRRCAFQWMRHTSTVWWTKIRETIDRQRNGQTEKWKTKKRKVSEGSQAMKQYVKTKTKASNNNVLKQMDTY